jgi:prophage regulatory protein
MNQVAHIHNQPLDATELRLVGRDGLNAKGISYSNVHLLRLEADGKFPKRLYLSPARVAWVESEVNEYLARCIAARG